MTLLTTVTAMTACTAPNTVSTQTDANGVSNIKVITNNPILSTKISASRIHLASVGDLKKASVSLRNGWFYKKSFEYKIVWFDASGTEINPEGASWKPITLEGREAKTVQSVAPNPTGADIMIYLKGD